MKIDWQSLRQRIQAEKRKAAMLAMLACFALLLWGRLLLKDVPRTAVANPSAPAAEAAADGAVGSKVTAASVLRPVVKVELSDAVNRDLFRFNSTHFPLIEKAESPEPVAKLADKRSDEGEQQRTAEMAVRVAARRFSLQSTLLGQPSRALINNVLLEVGETIDGFELVEVRERLVVLKKDGIEVILEM
jgi:hypothetical protein